MKWLELSLTLTGEVAEAVVEVISRHTPNSIAIEYPPGDVGEDPNARVIVRAYLQDDQDVDHRRKAIEEGLWHLSQIEPFPPPIFHWVEENVEETWKEHYQPLKIGERLLIQPTWLPVQPTERIPILMDPGMAFGTGTHPTTQLCLLALEKHLQPGQRVVDLGCGSGILSIAAGVIGASDVLGLDTDPNAIKYARKNVKRNSLGHSVKIRQGSFERLLGEDGRIKATADVLVANILTKVLIDLIQKGIGGAVRPDGLLILSGILDYQMENMIQIAQGHNLKHVETSESEDWRALILIRKSPR